MCKRTHKKPLKNVTFLLIFFLFFPIPVFSTENTQETQKQPPFFSDDFFSFEKQNDENMRLWRITTLNAQYIADRFAALPGVSYAFFHLTPLPDERSKDEKLRLTRDYLVRIQGDERIMSMSRQVLKTIEEIMLIQPEFYQAYLNLLNHGYIEKLPHGIRIMPEKVLGMIKEGERIPISPIFGTLSRTDAMLKQILEIYKTLTPFYIKEFNSFTKNESLKDVQ